MASPISAAASAGASLTPSPIIITGPFLRSDSTTRIFWSGVSSERTRSIDRPAATASRDLVAVAGRQHDALDAERAQLLQQRLRAGAQFVGQDQQAGELAVDRDGDRERAGRPVAAQRGEAASRQSCRR